ncbi:MAG TPA: hypothetical protein PKG80_08455, partial [Acidobacteriota bacterium]|nr:hypothetical protein [Acidobacteriota bacterium]
MKIEGAGLTDRGRVRPHNEDSVLIDVEHGVFAHFHAGDDVAFEPPFSSSPKVFHELKRRYPGLRLVLAHLGSLNMWDDVERLLVGGDYSYGIYLYGFPIQQTL